MMRFTGKAVVFFFALVISGCQSGMAQTGAREPGGPWVPDSAGDTYRNPVIFADYSDPDVCRRGDDFYLVSSSFNQIPGLPILKSKDLVNWKIIGHALLRLPPYDRYDSVRPGCGVWAPAIRFHKAKFYVYFPDPDYGIYLVTAKNPAGPWSEPLLVQGGKGLEDPCPFWDDNGNAYLVHAYAGSRAGIKSILVLNRMSADGTRLLDEGVIVYDGHGIDPTIEGPKLYKREGYYYIFAPAGGVTNGWQVVLRSKHIYGPYERRVVLRQGRTNINGPHQGAWIETARGQSWFIHFQDRGAYGRVDLLEPMMWKDAWPIIGSVVNGDSVGEPVFSYTKPDVGREYPIEVPQTSDEFNGTAIGKQWQWQANPGATWAFPSKSLGCLRLYARKLPDDFRNFWTVPNILSQKFPAEEFTATTRLRFSPKSDGERAGLMVLGASYAYISLVSKSGEIHLAFTTCEGADTGSPEDERTITGASDSWIYLRVLVTAGAVCSFSYSFDGKQFHYIGEHFVAKPGRWIGAKVGIFCTGTIRSDDSGYADFEWFRVH